MRATENEDVIKMSYATLYGNLLVNVQQQTDAVAQSILQANDNASV